MDIGDVDAGVVESSNQPNPSKIFLESQPVGYSPRISEYATAGKSLRNINGNKIDVLDYNTPEYKITCPSRSCAWDYELERLTPERKSSMGLGNTLTMEEKCREI